MGIIRTQRRISLSEKYLSLRSPPYLQVAIDVTDLEKAFYIARESVSCKKTILESGTPLIKAHGMLPIRLWSTLFDKPVLADMKTMDTGYLEAELAFMNGAFITTVMGVADDSTIMGAIKAGQVYKGLVQIDLMNIQDPVSRAEEVSKMGAHIIGLHAGIDQQGRGLKARDMAPLIRKLKNQLNGETLISIAGGIREEDIDVLVSSGADIIVVGSYITKSREPRKIVDKLCEKLL
jgi:3-hexulose-6-phosphate synthase